MDEDVTLRSSALQLNGEWGQTFLYDVDPGLAAFLSICISDWSDMLTSMASLEIRTVSFPILYCADFLEKYLYISILCLNSGRLQASFANLCRHVVGGGPNRRLRRH